MSLIQSIVHKAFLLERKIIFNNLPDKIFLVNHGETEANINQRLYTQIPEDKIKLTKKRRRTSIRNRKKITKINTSK